MTRRPDPHPQYPSYFGDRSLYLGHLPTDIKRYCLAPFLTHTEHWRLCGQEWRLPQLVHQEILMSANEQPFFLCVLRNGDLLTTLYTGDLIRNNVVLSTRLSVMLINYDYENDTLIYRIMMTNYRVTNVSEIFEAETFQQKSVRTEEKASTNHPLVQCIFNGLRMDKTANSEHSVMTFTRGSTFACDKFMDEKRTILSTNYYGGHLILLVTYTNNNQYHYAIQYYRCTE